MRYPAIYSTTTRAIHPHPDPLHEAEVVALIQAADLCEGAIPADPARSAEAMLVAIEDHLQAGQLVYALHHQQELDTLAGSMHRLGYADPEAAYPLGLEHAEDPVSQVQSFADQGSLAIEQYLGRQAS